MRKSPSVTTQSLVAIGYSTGGLDPLIRFFDRTPCDNASYIVLNHLPQNSVSYLRTILAHHSPLEVIEVHEQLTIENNKIYLMPPVGWLELSDGHLYPVKRSQESPNINRAIDTFLTTLARDKQYKKFAVFFSGNRGDGIDGARQLKNGGGRILVQDPATCKASGMPTEVIQAIDVDVVTIPEKMPAIIQAYIAADGVRPNVK